MNVPTSAHAFTHLYVSTLNDKFQVLKATKQTDQKLLRFCLDRNGAKWEKEVKEQE